jgi:TalC/MipB family fructose-6-phosphate aldolase
MSLYVDCAYLKDVARVCAGFPIAGVTTNPSILLAAHQRGQRLDDLGVLRELLELCDGHVFMQPVGASANDLYTAASRYLAVASSRVVPKLPATADGLRAGMRLTREGVRVAFTATCTLSQAYCAVAAGAGWIIPYFGRLRRSGIDPCERIGQMAQLVAGQSSGTRILAASIKTSGDLAEVTLAGAHDVTVQPDLMGGLLDDPLTESSIRGFEADWVRLQKERAISS